MLDQLLDLEPAKGACVDSSFILPAFSFILNILTKPLLQFCFFIQHNLHSNILSDTSSTTIMKIENAAVNKPSQNIKENSIMTTSHTQEERSLMTKQTCPLFLFFLSICCRMRNISSKLITLLSPGCIKRNTLENTLSFCCETSSRKVIFKPVLRSL